MGELCRMKNNARTARKGGVCYQPEPKVGVDTGNSQKTKKKKYSDGDFLTWEMQQGRVIRVSTEVS